MDHFTPKNEQLSALTKLEGISWYQGKDLVEEYIDQFVELIDLAKYHNSKITMIKFCKGLKSGTQTKVTLLGHGVPDFDNPKGGMRQLGGLLRTKRQMMHSW